MQRRGARMLAAAAEHSRYLTEVAMVPSDAKLDALVRVLKAQGAQLTSPADRSGLHPLVIPLAQSSQDDGFMTCLLRWPAKPKGMELPVVRMTRGGLSVQMLARSAAEYLHRAMAEEEAALGQGAAAGPVAEAAGAEGAALYEAGAFARSGLPTMQAYLTRKAGMYCDVAEALAQGHLARGDEMSALITAEWYTRPSHFPDWGRPYEFNSALLRGIGRLEEARDVARVAMRTPWWSLQEGFAASRTAAGMSGGADQVRAALDEQEEMANGGVLQGQFRTNPKTEQQVHMDEASHWMNRAAAGEVAWDEVRGQVAEEYRAAGLPEVAAFVETA